MGKALIQRQVDVQDAANVAFWVNLGIAVLIAGLLYIAASSITQAFFRDSRVTSVIQVMTLQVFLGALGSVQTALLQKEMGFKKLFWVRFVTVSLPGLASMPLAWRGMGYWALVAGTLVGQVVQVVMLWRMSPWRPSRGFRAQVAREMLRFGFWTAVAGVLTWFYIWGDTYFISRYLGLQDLGVYRMGAQIADQVFVIMFSAIMPVYYSYASSIKDREQLFVSTVRTIQQISFLSISCGYFFLCFGGTISSFLFSEKWSAIGGVVAILGLRQGFAWVTFLNDDFYRAIGKPHLPSLVLTLSLFFYVPVYYFTAQIDLNSFVYGRLSLVIVSLMLHISLLAWIVGVQSFLNIMKTIVVTALYYSVFYILVCQFVDLRGELLVVLFVLMLLYVVVVLFVYGFCLDESLKFDFVSIYKKALGSIHVRNLLRRVLCCIKQLGRKEFDNHHLPASTAVLRKIAGGSMAYIRPSFSDQARIHEFCDSIYAVDISLLNLVKEQKPCIIVDVGANIGLSTLSLVSAFSGVRRVVGIEAEKENFAVLKMNYEYWTGAFNNKRIDDNSRDKEVLFIPYYAIASNCDTSAAFDVKRLQGGISASGTFRFVEKSVDSNEICTVSHVECSSRNISLNTIFSENAPSVQDSAIVKVDIEGGEDVLFVSGTDWMNKTLLLTVELHDSMGVPNSSRNLIKKLAECDFAVVPRDDVLHCFNRRLLKLN